jgi:hypothetical protein
MAEWLVPEFESIYVYNTFVSVEKINDVYIIPTDILLFFDVEASFPNIPDDEALELLER